MVVLRRMRRELDGSDRDVLHSGHHWLGVGFCYPNLSNGCFHGVVLPRRKHL
ncbi:unnamed protein product [Linum tenue]|uniref:Uncharacterized protein n=1 Tax=Linum tenue TaxID=586396 RepID=A0AAV0NB70_9ROSI|nr:unnamed protein product [Linum tenue]